MNTNLAIVDEYGIAKAKLAELEDAAAAIRLQIIAMGVGEYEGKLFRATVGISPRTTPNWKAIAHALRPSFAYPKNRWSDDMVALYDANCTTSDITRVTCDARIGVAA